VLRDLWIPSEKQSLYANVVLDLFQQFLSHCIYQENGYMVVRDDGHFLGTEQSNIHTIFDAICY
jgi:hypothetical protein